jgi:hypothetical protein
MKQKQFRPVGMGWWVDPRIMRICSEDLQRYLAHAGWHRKAQPRQDLAFFEKTDPDGEVTVLTVPVSEDLADYVQRLIEAVTTLAAQEQRYAPEILTEILSQPSPKGPPYPRATPART